MVIRIIHMVPNLIDYIDLSKLTFIESSKTLLKWNQLI